jgi:two-component system cell cycle sensor histidine kinase/response regulator CckA
MIYVDLAYSITSLVALSFVSALVRNRWGRHVRWTDLLQGVLFGGAAVLGMLRPLSLDSGFVVDGRSILVSLCALFFGPWAAAAAGALTMTCGVWLDGPWRLGGSLSILAAAGIGLLAHFRLKPEASEPSARTLYLFGLAVHSTMLAIMFMFSGKIGSTLLMATGPLIILVFPLATVLAAKVFLHQVKLHRIKEATAGQEDEPLLNTLLDAIPIPVFYKDKDGRYLGFNRAFETFFGAIREQMVGKTVFEIHPLELARVYHAKDTELFQERGVQQYESQVKNAHGVVHDVAVYKAVFTDSRGAVSGLIGTVLDITDRKKAEEDLQRSNDMLRAIIEAAPAAIIGLDLEGNVHSVWNPAAEKMLGWRAGEVMGRPLPTVPVERQHEFTAFRERIRNGMTLNGVEVCRQRCDGTPIDYSIYASPLHDAEGRISGNIAVLVDITERKRAEAERQAHLRILESMDKVNRAIQGARDLDHLMSDVLDVVLSIFDCDRAYLLYPCDPEAESWTSPMERCKPEYPGVLALGLEMPMTQEVAETFRILLNSDAPVKFGPETEHPLPGDIFERFGIKSFLSMALHPRVGKPWQFGIHQCAHARVWTQEEERLLQGIGRRLIDALTSLLAHRDLRKSEEFLKNIVDNIPNMIFVKDAEALRFVRFNKAGEQLLGYSQEEMLGKNDHDLFPKEEADFFTAKDREVLDKKKLVDIPEETIRSRSNTQRILHTKKIPILDENGRPQYLLGISEDITDRKTADASLRKLSQAIEQTPVSIVITDTSGTIEFVNTKFTQITGYSQAEALGKNPRILKSSETSAEEYARLWKTISSGGVWRGEFHNRKKNGELFWEYATIAPIRNADKVISHYVAVKEDITERKKLEEQLRQVQKMEAVGQLAGGVAHDFNNMLGVIIGHSELALAQMDAAQPFFSHLVEIRKAAERSADLTRQLLAFARKQTVAPKVLDLNETIEGMLKLLRRLIGEDIQLTWQPEMQVWPIKVDPSQIDQVLANLCVNARDAIKGVGRVNIETHRVAVDEAYCADHPEAVPGGYTLLIVSDNGCGMDHETLGRIFEPFFTTKEQGKGTGLGLATVYGIVKQNNGFINVSSEPGQGTTFEIHLPHHMAKADEAQEESLTAPVARGNETILIVEDEPTILNLARLMLESLGYRVLTTSSPFEAVRIAREHADEIHLLLSDVVMPEMNGRELADRLTSLRPGITCLFMSGYTSDVIARHGVLEKGINHIEKPFSIQTLAAKVREALSSKPG